MGSALGIVVESVKSHSILSKVTDLSLKIKSQILVLRLLLFKTSTKVVSGVSSRRRSSTLKSGRGSEQICNF